MIVRLSQIKSGEHAAFRYGIYRFTGNAWRKSLLSEQGRAIPDG